MRKPGKRGGSFQRRTIEDELALLRGLDLKGLRTRWQNEFGRPAPEHLTRYLLFRIIAYRIQADRLGDLDAETLKILARAAGQEGRPSVSKGLVELDRKRSAPPPGTVLVREWDRKSHRVMSCRTPLPGTARPSAASPRSPLPSPGPSGMAPVSSV